METRIRPATAAEVPFVAEVIALAARSHLPRGAWDLLVDDEAAGRDFRLRVAAAEPRGFTRWSGFLVAAVDGRPAAGLGSAGITALARGLGPPPLRRRKGLPRLRPA